MDLDRSTIAPSKEIGWTGEPERALPADIGRYRILHMLGEGGMGVVYEAEQENPRRAVALKLIKIGFATAELRRRFEQESSVLGRLHHPGIAQIYEAGVADTGFGPQPFFAMELVRGQPLREYADSHRLNVRQRLELLVKVCEAIDHAHQRGIIHRDLKPGNIFVEDSGQPKILDFGVARATDSDAQATRHTNLGQLVGTLAYMSPEQALADSTELDERSDVYALGVVCYELLAGRLPYRAGPNLNDAVRAIREEDPLPLSSIDRTCRGDIETIVNKALEKDKARRYLSAAELAADIQRYLADQPILARPVSTAYQLQKFAKRHKAFVGGVAAIFVVLSLGIMASLWQAAVARQERNRALAEKQRADTEAETAKAVNDFLQSDLLGQASAYAQAHSGGQPDPDLKVRTALDRAAAGISGKFRTRPAVEASVRQTIGTAYWDLGLFHEAQDQMEHALALRRRVFGEQHPETLESMMTLADLSREQGRFIPAEELFKKVLDIRRRALGSEHRDTLAALSGLAAVYIGEGRDAEAETLLIKTLEIRRRVLGPEHPDTLDSMNSLSTVYTDEGKYSQAEPLVVKLLEADGRVHGADHPDTLLSMYNLAWVYLRQGKYAQAEPLVAEAFARRRRVLGEQHPDTLESMRQLARLYTLQGKYAQAEPLYAKVLELQNHLLGADDPDTAVSMHNLGVLYSYEHKDKRAEELLVKTLEIDQRTLGKDHPDTLTVLSNLGHLYQQQKKYMQAAALYAKVVDGRRHVLGPDHPALASAEDSLGWVRLKQGRYAEAEQLFREALNAQQKASSDSWERYNSESLLGACLEREGKYAVAEPPLLAGYQGLMQRRATIPFSERLALDDAGISIVRLYRNWGKPDKAAEWREKLKLTAAAPSRRP